MMQILTASEMMLKMGFPPSETGPYVTELRALIERKSAEGRVGCSGVTWADECYELDDAGFITGYKISHEDRAKAMLEMEWAVDNGHSYRVSTVDPIICRTFNTTTMRRGIRVRWSSILPWVGDRWKETMMNIRVWHGGKNPYRETAKGR